ncbi:MAG: DUF935 family protein [bacterium]
MTAKTSSAAQGRKGRRGLRGGPGPAGGVTITQRVRAINRWRDQYNPLRSLTIQRAVSLLEQYQRGEFADPLWTMFFVEQRDADMIALVELTMAAILELDWNVKVVAEEKRRSNFDEKVAEDQAQFLRDAYDRISNLYEAIEHLGMARFRGFALAQPQVKAADAEGEAVGTVFGANHIECLDPWNVARDGLYGDWFWNPDARSTTARALGEEARLDLDGMLIRTVRRPIDVIALIKFIRQALCDKDWDSFVEIYGLPQPIIIGPADVSDDKAAEFEDAAADVAEGGSGYLPNGSDVKYPDSVRGVSPFKERMTHLTEKLILAGTGGMLTMLTQSGSGTLAGSAHMETFQRIARAEARRISEVFQKQFDRLLLEQQFPGYPILAYFELAADEEQDVGEIIKHNGELAASGFRIKQSDLEEKTGYELEPFSAASVPADTRGSGGVPFRRRDPTSVNRDGPSTPLRAGPDPAGVGDLLAAAAMELSEAQRKDLSALAEPLIAIYRKSEVESVTPEQLARELSDLKARLPDILKEINADPSTAAVFERLMAAALANGIEAEAGR